MTDEEWLDAAVELVERIGTRARITNEESLALFNLYNSRVPQWWTARKSGISCGRCLAQVWERVNDRITKQKAKKDEAE